MLIPNQRNTKIFLQLHAEEDETELASRNGIRANDSRHKHFQERIVYKGEKFNELKIMTLRYGSE